jgi:crossover junction endodeoxyribonuclease RuvC
LQVSISAPAKAFFDYLQKGDVAFSLPVDKSDIFGLTFPFVRVSCYCNKKTTGSTVGASSMRVLGIDPGLRNMGWGVIEVDGSRMRHLGNGVCKSEGKDLGLRLLSLHRQLTDVLCEFQPTTAAVEQTFVNKDGAGTLKLGQARGIALLVPAQAGLEIGEYAPNKVKKTVVGVGHAAKEQVQHMVKLQVPGVVLKGPDAADALAIAMCHAHYTRSTSVWEKAKEAANG